MLIGIISDTHGLLRPEAAAALDGAELILHAGDVGSPRVLEELDRIAPVVAIRGNVDTGAWCDSLAERQLTRVGDIIIYMVHDVHDLDLAAGEPVHVVVSGHSHAPSIERRDGVLYVNPGSAGPRRFSLPITVVRMRVEGASVDAEVVTLPIAGQG